MVSFLASLVQAVRRICVDLLPTEVLLIGRLCCDSNVLLRTNFGSGTIGAVPRSLRCSAVHKNKAWKTNSGYRILQRMRMCCVSNARLYITIGESSLRKDEVERQDSVGQQRTFPAFVFASELSRGHPLQVVGVLLLQFPPIFCRYQFWSSSAFS